MQIQPSFLAYTPPWGTVHMTQAWRRRGLLREDGGWGEALLSPWLKLRRKPLQLSVYDELGNRWENSL